MAASYGYFINRVKLSLKLNPNKRPAASSWRNLRFQKIPPEGGDTNVDGMDKKKGPY